MVVKRELSVIQVSSSLCASHWYIKENRGAVVLAFEFTENTVENEELVMDIFDYYPTYYINSFMKNVANMQKVYQQNRSGA